MPNEGVNGLGIAEGGVFSTELLIELLMFVLTQMFIRIPLASLLEILC
jgi:hypothetical protein